MIPDEGIRITDLAVMAQMTKQALGEFADRLKDPDSSAASETTLTAASASCSARTSATRQPTRLPRYRLDRGQWRQEIGPELYDAMKQALRKVGHESLKP